MFQLFQSILGTLKKQLIVINQWYDTKILKGEF